jgi:hypothetical protein
MAKKIKELESILELKVLAGNAELLQRIADSLKDKNSSVTDALAGLAGNKLPPPPVIGGPPPPPPPGMGGPPPPPSPGMGGPPPPPPPSPGMGGPPPPPPPGMGGPPGPPPPPGMGGPPPPPGIGGPSATMLAPVGPPPKPTNLSTKPLKSLNWAKIPPMKVQETIWKELDDSKIHKVLKGVSYLEFEDLFAAREMKDISSVDAVIAPVVSKEVTFLDSKRAQGINIMLKAIKLDPKAIKRAILTVDTDTLPRFALVELLKLVPTEDELATLKQYGDPKNLATAERFMYEISEIEIYEAKLKGMFFKVSFPELEDDAETMLNALGKSAREVMDSEKLKEILRVRLMI